TGGGSGDFRDALPECPGRACANCRRTRASGVLRPEEARIRMVRSVGRIVIAAAAIGADVLVGNAAVSIYHTAVLRNESAAVLHSNDLLLALDNGLSLGQEAQSAQRGEV